MRLREKAVKGPTVAQNIKVPLTQKNFFSLLKVLIEYSVLAKEFFDFI